MDGKERELCAADERSCNSFCGRASFFFSSSAPVNIMCKQGDVSLAEASISATGQNLILGENKFSAFKCVVEILRFFGECTFFLFFFFNLKAA